MPFISDAGRIVDITTAEDPQRTVICLEAPIPREDTLPDGRRRYLLEITGTPPTGLHELLDGAIGLDVVFHGLLHFPQAGTPGTPLELHVSVQAMGLTPASWIKTTQTGFPDDT